MGLAPKMSHQASNNHSVQKQIQTLNSNAGFKMLIFFNERLCGNICNCEKNDNSVPSLLRQHSQPAAMV